MVKHRSMKRRSGGKRRGGKSRARSMRRSRSMRGGNLTNDSSYSTLISSSSDDSSYMTGQSGAFQQNVDRNNSNISGEGNNVDMSQFKGLIPPGAYYGGRRRRHRMRGGVGEGGPGINGDQSESGVGMDGQGEYTKVSDEETATGSAPTQAGGRRRRRRMRGGDDTASALPSTRPSTMPSALAGDSMKPMTAMNPDTATIPAGGMYDPPKGPGSTPTSGGTRKRRGGSVVATAALPFGLFGLQKYFQGRKSDYLTRKLKIRGGNESCSKTAYGGKKRRGGNMVATAALPFGLLALQKYAQDGKRNRNRR